MKCMPVNLFPFSAVRHIPSSTAPSLLIVLLAVKDPQDGQEKVDDVKV